MLIWRALTGHLLGASCGYKKNFRGPQSGSRSLQIRPDSVRPSVHPSIHPYDFFFRADSGATKWNCSRRNVKKDVQKSDIALITSSRVSSDVFWSPSCFKVDSGWETWKPRNSSTPTADAAHASLPSQWQIAPHVAFHPLTRALVAGTSHQTHSI